MRISVFNSLLLFSGGVALSACVAVPQYETITSTAATTSTLGGTAVQFGVANGGAGPITGLDMTTLTGSVRHNTGEISIFDGTYLLVDPNGFDISGVATDGVEAGIRLDAAGTGLFTRTYDYVIPFEYAYSAGAGVVVPVGTAGIVTRGADMPVSGTAQYTGEAYAQVISAGGATDFALSRGISIVDVNFRAGSVDVTMGFFGSVNAYGSASVAPIDALSGQNMTIVGASFVGGTWVTLKNGAMVNYTGSGTTTAAGGDFYGYDASISAPDEVGGVIMMDGASGKIFGIFIAD